MHLVTSLKLKNKTLVICIIAISIACVNIFCSRPAPTSHWPVLKEYASLNDSVKYVGINSCKQCHVDIYNTFVHTGMGLSFDAATQQKTSARFDEHALVYDKYKNFYYKPYWQNDSLRLLEFRLEGKDTIHKRTEAIDFIVGSGQHTNSHMVNTNGYLNQAPLTFYTQKGTWDLPPGFENGNNSRFSRIIGLECMSCHNAYPNFIKGSENKYSEIKRGIDCERCHGPGEYHVLQKQAGILVDTSKVIDYSIVNPAKLPIGQQLDVCQRCHIQGNAVLNEGKSFLDFKPGMHLSEVMNVFMPVYKGRESEHIMASHAERMKQSKCFTETMRKVAEGTAKNTLKPYKDVLTCVTCHNPHVSVKATSDDRFISVCKSCHQGTNEVMCSEKEVVRKKKNNNCISCHMPSSGATDIPHVSVHDHKIGIPLTREEVSKVKEFVGITCINNPNVSNKTKGDAYIAYFEKFNFDVSVLDSALKYLPSQKQGDLKTNFQSLVQLYFLKEDYLKVVELSRTLGNPLESLTKKSLSNNDAWTAYRIAASFQNLNDLAEALRYYKRAVELAPYQLDMMNKYASALSLSGNIKDAKFYLEKILEEYPKHTSALTNLGFIYLSADQKPEAAAACYRKALDLNPDYEPALLNQAGLYLYLGKTQDAELLLKRILKLNPANLQAKQILQQLKSDS